MGICAHLREGLRRRSEWQFAADLQGSARAAPIRVDRGAPDDRVRCLAVSRFEEHRAAGGRLVDPQVHAHRPPAEAGIRVRAVDDDLGGVAGAALHIDGYEGHARMVVDEDRKVLVGFTLVGPDVAELLHAATIAITAEVPLDRLWHAVPAFPTLSEVWLRLLETYEHAA